MGTVRSGFWTLNLQKKSFLSFFSYNFFAIFKAKKASKKEKNSKKKKERSQRQGFLCVSRVVRDDPYVKNPLWIPQNVEEFFQISDPISGRTQFQGSLTAFSSLIFQRQKKIVKSTF